MEKHYWIVVADTTYCPTGLVYFSDNKADALAKAEEFAKLISPDVINKHDGEQFWLTERDDEAVVAVIPAITANEVFEQCKGFLGLLRRNGAL